MITDFKGISFPFRKGRKSFPEKVEGDDLIRESVLQILLTARGERVMRPDFGSGVFRLVFENTGRLMEEMIKTEVVSVLTKYEPRISVRNVSVFTEGSSVDVEIDYVVISTRRDQKVNMNFNRPAP